MRKQDQAHRIQREKRKEKRDGRHHFNPLLSHHLVSILALLLLILFAPATFAQDGSNWLQTVVNSQIEVQSLQGGTQFLPYPQLQATFQNTLDYGYNIYPVGGDLLRPSTAGYCTFVLAGDSQPMEIPASGAVEVEIVGYCLELPDDANGKKPDEFANYLPINYAGQTSEAVRNVLQKARDGNLTREFATQLAVWEVHNGVSRAELSERVGQDLTAFGPVLAYLLADGPLPEPTAIPTALPPTPTPEETEPEAEIAVADDGEDEADTTPSEESVAPTTPAADQLFGFDRNLVLIAGAVVAGLLLLTLFGLLLVMRRRSRAAAAHRQRRRGRGRVATEKRAPAPSPRGSRKAPVTESGLSTFGAEETAPRVHCLICGENHETRECPNIQRPNQVFVPTEVELTLANVDEAAPPEHDETPMVPEIDAFWGRYAPEQQNNEEVEGTHFLQPNQAPTVDQEFFEAARQRSRPQVVEELKNDTSSVIYQQIETGSSTEPVSRKNVTYIVREEGKADILGSLGDDGGIVSRVSLKDQQILLPPKDVSTPHAILRLRPDGRVTIKDLRSKNGTFVYDERLDAGEQTLLHDGANLRFGDSAEFELDLDNRRLVSLNGNQINRDLSSSDQWLITRRNLHSIVIPNTHISTPHLLIRPNDDDVSEIRIKDLCSSNPTILDDNSTLSSYENGTYVTSDGIDFRVGDSAYVITARGHNTPDQIGEHYNVTQQIYISKMADVYQVEDGREQEAQPLVAKMLNVHQEKQESAREAFDTEIALMRQIDNPHILPCLDTGHDNAHDAPFFIMPFLDGDDVRRIMQSRRRNEEFGGLHLPEIQQIFTALLHSLNAIHEHGYAHCDIKPANIFITPSNDVYLLDLGVVTKLGEHAEFFTQFYSAPEVGAKQLPPVSTASDVYSLGVVLFELLTGVEAKDLSGFATGANQDRPDTESSRPNPNSRENLEQWLSTTPVGMDFLDVIHKATQYVATERYESIDAFREALDAAYQGERCQQELNDSADLAALEVVASG